jgi:DNA polymerase-1
MGKWIQWYLTFKHRRNYLSNIKDPENKGVLAMIDKDGKVEADGFTCGTPTARYRHMGAIVNLPACNSKVLYGCELRSVFYCPEPYKMIGSDLSAIEARLLAHFTSLFDGGEMAKEILEGDIHTKNAELIGKDRNTAKVFFYSVLYGAGASKLSTTLQCSLKEAEKIIKDFYDGNPGLRDLKGHIERFYKKHKYIEGLDGRHLFIRSNHILLNSLIQGGAAIIFKDWGCRIWRDIRKYNLNSNIIIAMHDEYQLRTHKNHVERQLALLPSALKETEEKYKIKVPLATDSSVGMNYSQTH